MKEVIKPIGGAYVTFLAGKGDYVKGVVGLAKGLRKVETVYPLIVAVLPDVPEEHRQLLRNHGCVVREIEPIYPPQNMNDDCTNDAYARADYAINYSKLRIWEFVEYEKMVYLDGDIQVYGNIDHLFDLPNGHFYAVISCFCSSWWSGTPQYEMGYCPQWPHSVVQWPAHLYGPPPSTYFNAGMFVFEPSLSTYQGLIDTLEVTPPTLFAEQDLLYMYFKDKKFKGLPIEYNLLLFYLWRHPEKVNLSKVKVVHYCATGSKPWWYNGKGENMDREDVKMLVQKWWDIYNDPLLDYQIKIQPQPNPEPQAQAQPDLEPQLQAQHG